MQVINDPVVAETCAATNTAARCNASYDKSIHFQVVHLLHQLHCTMCARHDYDTATEAATEQSPAASNTLS